jgi:SAM-dependent methyltransferase
MSYFTPTSTIHLLIFLAVAFFVYGAIRTKIPMIPSQKIARKTVLAQVKAEVAERGAAFGQGLIIYDLGSGFGGLCFDLAKMFPAAQVIGIEMIGPLWLLTWLRQKLAGPKNLRFLWGDFWKRNVSDGDIFIFYLGDVVMAQMGAKLKAEAKTGSLILSNTFPLPADWRLDHTVPLPAKVSKMIYVYRR